jgi:HSP20 family protein
MASLVRKSHEREPAPLGRLHPMRELQDLIRLDPFRALTSWNPFATMSGVESASMAYMPDIEVKETSDAIVICADVPGVNEKDIDVSISGNLLTVSGRREEEAKEEGDQYYACERSYGSFSRSFTLPEGTDPEHVKAELKDGVLTVDVPKKESVHSRKIPIGAEKKAEAKEAGTKPKAT